MIAPAPGMGFLRGLRQGSAALLFGAIVVSTIVCWHPTKGNAAFSVSIKTPGQLCLPQNRGITQNVFISNPRDEKHLSVINYDVLQFASAEFPKLHSNFLTRTKDDRIRSNLIPF